MSTNTHAPVTEVAIEKYGDERQKMYNYVQDCSERGYPVEVEKWEKGSLIGIEVILNDDRLAHFGTLQDISRGAIENWFLRDLEPVGDNKVRIEFCIDTDIDFSQF